MTCRAIVRLVHPPGRITAGRVLFEGRDLAPLSERELEHVRGHGVVMVFQDPMTALNPVLSVERQIVEILPAGRGPESAARPRGGTAPPRRHPGPGAAARAPIRTSSRVVSASG